MSVLSSWVVFFRPCLNLSNRPMGVRNARCRVARIRRPNARMLNVRHTWQASRSRRDVPSPDCGSRRSSSAYVACCVVHQLVENAVDELGRLGRCRIAWPARPPRRWPRGRACRKCRFRRPPAAARCDRWPPSAQAPVGGGLLDRLRRAPRDVGERRPPTAGRTRSGRPSASRCAIKAGRRSAGLLRANSDRPGTGPAGRTSSCSTAATPAHAEANPDQPRRQPRGTRAAIPALRSSHGTDLEGDLLEPSRRSRTRDFS